MLAAPLALKAFFSEPELSAGNPTHKVGYYVEAEQVSSALQATTFAGLLFVSLLLALHSLA